jgi:hypothetical protein
MPIANPTRKLSEQPSTTEHESVAERKLDRAIRLYNAKTTARGPQKVARKQNET